ncbi:MAG: hypothetical protein KH268_11270 [Clostridiales bacterium]|nr:hypothetical protein [Clostridiales bacterium]
MKKILIGFSITFSLIIFFSMATFNYSQASSPSSTDEIDSYLQSINVPENVLNGMSLHEKQTIYNSLTETGEEVQYCSHTESDSIRPATMDFSGASFDIPNIGAYEGTATIIARRVSNLMSHSIILGYVADKTSNGASIGVTFGPLDISYSGELGKVDTVTDMLSLTW